MSDRGLYELNYGGLSWGELWRFAEGKPLVFLFALGFKLGGKRGPKIWLPARENEAACAESELSERARTHLLPVVEQARALNYGNGRFTRLARRDNPSAKEGFSYTALHADGVRTLFIAFLVMEPENQPTVEKVTVAGAINLVDGSSIGFTGEKMYLNGAANVKRVSLKDGSVAAVDAAMAVRVVKEGFSVRRFDGWESMKRAADDATDEAFEARIRRGLYITASEQQDF